MAPTLHGQVRPVRSRKSLNRLLSSIAAANLALRADASVAHPLPLNKVLGAASRIAKTNYMVLVFSDFDEIDDRTEALMRTLSANNDLILFNVEDPLAQQIPPGLKLAVSDGELQAELDTSEGPARERLETLMTGRLARVFGWS